MKHLVLGNPGTKIMALFLAVLLWVYLYTRENDNKTFAAPFEPVLAIPPQLAEDLHVEYDSNHGELLPGKSSIIVTVEGPRAEIAKLKDIRFAPTFDAGFFDPDKEGGAFNHEIQLKDFGLPESFRIVKDPTRTRQIDVHYEKYVVREAELEVSQSDLLGEPERGFFVKDVRCRPPKVRVRVPAQKQVDRIGILPEHIDGATENITKHGRLAKEVHANGRPFEVSLAEGESFDVLVFIEPEAYGVQRGPIPLRLEGDVKVLPRIRLDTSGIFLQIEGPRHIVNELRDNDVVVFVPVPLKEGDLRPEGDRKIVPASEIRYYFRNTDIRKVLKVTLMSDQKPENRQVTLIVLPEGER